MHRLLRAFARPDFEVLSVQAQAKLSAAQTPVEPNQFRLLVRHLLDRFFNNEMLSVGGETLPLIMTVAGAIAVPTLILAILLFPEYHAFPPKPIVPPFWNQAVEHYLYAMYSFVAMGAITVFEADMLFPNLLDMLVLSTLPIPHRRMVRARVAATLLFLVLFLFGINSFGIVAYPMTTERVTYPVTDHHVPRLFVAHLVAVTVAGTFSAASFLALQGLLICTLSGRMYRAASTVLQGTAIAGLLMVLFLFPAVSRLLDTLIPLDTMPIRCFPPFWFLGIYECILAGPSRLPVFVRLAHTGLWATSIAVLIAIATYPLAYRRRARQAIEGTASRHTKNPLARPMNWLLHKTILRAPAQRAVYHFIGQTLRTPRHRVYLAMYAGLGVALMFAYSVGITIAHGRLEVGLTPSGFRSVVPGVAFWAVSGLCSALAAPTNPGGGWVFRVIDGRPTLVQLDSVRIWVTVWGLVVTLGVVALLYFVSPLPLRHMRELAAQALLGAGVCVLLADAFLLTSRTIPFTEMRIPLNTDLAFVLLRYIVMFPAVVLIAVRCGPWVESHLLMTALAFGLAHGGLRYAHRRMVSDGMSRPEINEVDGIIQGLGLIG